MSRDSNLGPSALKCETLDNDLIIEQIDYWTSWDSNPGPSAPKCETLDNDLIYFT